MNGKTFDYTQRFQARVITDLKLERFIWDHFNFGTSYNEPFGQISLRDASSQPYVFSQSIKPVRVMELEFTTMYFHGPQTWPCPAHLSFDRLQEFYYTHGCHKKFIFNHPVYGDMVVRFAKPIVMPKKNIGGSSTVQGFGVTLAEVIDTDYLFQRGENFSGELPLHAAYYDVEMEYVEDTLVAPLGGNYHMVFKKTKKPLRTLKLNLEGMKYFFNRDDGSLNISDIPDRNMALLELFYLKHRLSEVFKIEYAGEEISVRFKEPLIIPKVATQTGVLDSVQITLVETPFQQLTKDDLK